MQSYLELISLYKDLLARKREELRLDKERLENGVTKIAQASAQVSHYNVCCCQCTHRCTSRLCILLWIRALKQHDALS